MNQYCLQSLQFIFNLPISIYYLAFHLSSAPSIYLYLYNPISSPQLNSFILAELDSIFQIVYRAVHWFTFFYPLRYLISKSLYKNVDIITSGKTPFSNLDFLLRLLMADGLIFLFFLSIFNRLSSDLIH